jgi:LacI family transcriptional regulator
MSRVTLQAIADQLGISKFAVSRALTGKSGVSDDTRRTVMATAEKLGYMARKRNGMDGRSIEVIFHDRNVANRELWIDVQQGVDAEATRLGFSMAVRWTNDHRIIQQLESSAAAFILIGPHERAMFEAARDSKIHAITVSHVVPALDTMDQITATDVEAGVYVANYLAGLGHRRLVYAHGQLGYPGRFARLRGFAEAIAEIPDAELREIAFQEDHTGVGLREALAEMVGQGFEPTAFFCGSDGVAVTVVSELMRMGLRVPEDVSVVGHADYPIATQVSPKLTTIHMPHRQMGIAAVRLVLSRSGLITPVNDLPPQRLSLVPTLVERQSTARATTKSWRHKVRPLPSESV